MSDKADPNTQAQATDRGTSICRVLDDYLACRARGESVSSDDVIQKHPDLMPELADEFAKLELIDQARLGAAGQDSTLRGPDHSAAHRDAMVLCCPHCQVRFEVDTETSLAGIHCPACGEHFHVVGRPAVGRTPPRIGRFELIERLGVGSFGAVWRARDAKLDRDVAIKIPLHGRLEPLEIEEFLREARFAARLKHPHIVSVYEVGHDGDSVYIVSDLIDGQQLDHWTEDHAFTIQDTARLCRQVALALDHAHDKEVVHRDLKPANIMIDKQGKPHLTDFGLAKETTAEITMTLDGHILGTIAYMSPEQARGEASRCDRRSDVYSLGVVLFELLTGELPFRGNMSVLPQKVIHDEPPSPRRLNRHVPRDLVTICLKCLQKAPQQRYQTAKEVADDLQNWLDRMPISARPVGRVEHSWRWCRRHPMAAGFASSLLAVLLLMTAALLILIPVFKERLEASKRDIQAQSKFELRDLMDDVDRAAEEASSVPGLTAELEREYLPIGPPGNDVMQRFVEDLRDATEKKFSELYGDRQIHLKNWFLLDEKGLLRASSDAEKGKRVIGKPFGKRRYFSKAPEGTADVFEPYLSENDGQYKVPVSTKFVRDGVRIGVLVASVSTPGTRVLDRQAQSIRDLYVWAGVSFTPLALFVLAVAISWLWPRLRRPVAADRA